MSLGRDLSPCNHVSCARSYTLLPERFGRERQEGSARFDRCLMQYPVSTFVNILNKKEITAGWRCQKVYLMATLIHSASHDRMLLLLQQPQEQFNSDGHERLPTGGSAQPDKMANEKSSQEQGLSCPIHKSMPNKAQRDSDGRMSGGVW